MSPPAPASDPSSPPKKRKKTQLACHPCRARKTGCDGRRPYCSSCLMRSCQDRCTYQETVPSSAPTLLELDKRLRTLEETTQPFVSSVIATDSTDHEKSSHVPPVHQSRDPSDNETSPPLDSAPVHTSTSSFVEQVTLVVGTGYEHADKTGIGIGHWSSHYITTDVKDLILPPRGLADNILRCYWDLFNPILPILHRPTFDVAYSQLWQPVAGSEYNEAHNVLFHATLNTVLALGCQRNEGLEEIERENLCKEFYRRSVKLVSLDTLDTASLQIVQLLILRGYYLLYTPFADRCWNAVGVALRVAQAIGLQSGETANSNQLTREIRRRVWYACVMLDRMTSVSFDRPRALLRNPKAPLPQLIDDEYLSETMEGRQPDNLPSRLDFLGHLIKLWDLREIFQVDETKFLNIGENYSGKELGSTLDYISELDILLECLPFHLRRDDNLPASGNESCFQLQGRVLKAMVMYARLRILRPLILAEAKRSVSATGPGRETLTSNIQNKLVKDLCVLCVSTAHDVLETLHRQLFTVYRSSPWHSLYFTFAAASILVAAILCPSLGVQFDQDPSEASWQKALEIFAFHRTHVASAEKGIEALEKFRAYVYTRGGKQQGKTTADNKVQSKRPDAPTTSAGFDLNSESQIFPEVSELFDPVPIDESWFTSQDIYFDDILNWK